MKKILVAASVAVLFALAAAFAHRDEIAMLMAFNKLKPAAPFRNASSPAAPDYSQPNSWTALPDREDSADALPAVGVMDEQKNAAVDVFFIHPTTYLGTENWNQALEDARVNQLTDLFVMRGQAAAFNACRGRHTARWRRRTSAPCPVPPAAVAGRCRWPG